jgi:hypothetical protein
MAKACLAGSACVQPQLQAVYRHYGTFQVKTCIHCSNRNGRFAPGTGGGRGAI